MYQADMAFSVAQFEALKKGEKPLQTVLLL